VVVGVLLGLLLELIDQELKLLVGDLAEDLSAVLQLERHHSRLLSSPRLPKTPRRYNGRGDGADSRARADARRRTAPRLRRGRFRRTPRPLREARDREARRPAVARPRPRPRLRTG